MSSVMPVLAVIPARLAATRLPRKPLRLLGGEPLVVRVYERVASLGVADSCVVATDSVEVLEACKSRGVPAVLTQDSHPSGTDRVAEVSRLDQFSHFDVILNVQGDEPFVSSEALAGAVEIVKSGAATIGTAATRVPLEALAQPDIVKVVCTDAGKALYFSRAPIPWLRDKTDQALLGSVVRQHIGIYAYTRDALNRWVSWPAHPLELIERLEQLRPLAHGLSIGVANVAHKDERGIDTEEDLVRANAFWNSLHPGHH